MPKIMKTGVGIQEKWAFKCSGFTSLRSQQICSSMLTTWSTKKTMKRQWKYQQWVVECLHQPADWVICQSHTTLSGQKYTDISEITYKKSVRCWINWHIVNTEVSLFHTSRSSLAWYQCCSCYNLEFSAFSLQMCTSPDTYHHHLRTHYFQQALQPT